MDTQAQILGTLIVNGGGEELLIPEAELRRADEMGGCGHCGADLPPRTHSGGPPRRFCSNKCRSAHHAGCNPPSNPTVNSPSNASPWGHPRHLAKSGGSGGSRVDAVASLVAELVRTNTPQELVDRVVQAITPEAPAEENFDWSRDDSIVMKDQPATALYWNRNGQLVIRQEAGALEDTDSFIYVAPNQIRTLIDRLCDAIGVGGAP